MGPADTIRMGHISSPVPRSPRRIALGCCLIACLVGPGSLQAQDTRGVSLDSLLNVPVSSASKHLQTVRDAPASVSIITAEQIASYGWTDLGQLLNSLGGFYSSYDRTYTYIGVRGFGRPTDYNNRLLLLIDGHTINEGFWGSTPAGSDLVLDLRSLARIEVVRGPGSALYGNNAVFAVINLITKDGAEVDGARVYGATASYGNHTGSVLAGTQLAFGLDLVASGVYGESDGQTLHFPELEFDSATGGTIRDQDWEKRAGGSVRLSHANSGLSLMTRYLWRKKGNPTADYEQIPGNPNSSMLDRYLFAEVGLDRALTPALQLSARGYADFYKYEGDYAYDPLYTESADNRIAGGEAILRWDLNPGNRTTLGSEYRNNYRARYQTPRGSNPTLVYGDPHRAWSVFAQHEADLAEWLTLVAGVRYDDHSRVGGHLSPRGAVVFHPDRVTSIKLLYGEAFRAPSISEADNGGVPTISGTPLRAEVIRTLEVIAQRQLSRGLLLTAGAFQYRMMDLIDQILVDTVYEFRNSAKAVAHGGYLEAEWQGQSGAEASLSASLTRAEDDATDARLTNSPTVLIKAGLAVPLPAGFGLGVRSRFENGRITVVGTETDDFFLTDAYLRWAPNGRLSRLDAGLRVNNLFDADWAAPGGVQHLQPAIPQDGRNLVVTLGLRF